MTDVRRVVLVDDSADIRDLIRLAIGRDDRFDLVAEATDGEAGLALIREHRPDIALLDLAMPVMDGLEVLDALAREDGEAPVTIVLSGFSSGPPEEAAMEHGASGYIEKGLSLREMGDRILEIYDRARAS